MTRDGEVHEPYGPLVDVRPLVPPPDCKELVTKAHAPYPAGEKPFPDDKKGFMEYATAAAFEKRYECPAPESVDFARERIVVMPYDGDLSISWELDSAVLTDNTITVITAMTMACGGGFGAPDIVARRVLLFAVPRSEDALEIVTCINPMPDC